MGLSDFSNMGDLCVTVAGEPSLICSITSAWPFSGFELAHVVLGGESFVALAEGLQNALWSLGGAPEQHRSDSLSAAFRNLDANAQEDLTRRYEALCAHYGMTPTRNNKGVSHENGSIESAHGHIKKALEDDLLLRGSREFDDLSAWRRFVDELVSRRNARNAAGIDLERAALKDLPERKTSDYEEERVTVTSTSGFALRKVFYTRAVAADRPQAAGSALRRPARGAFWAQRDADHLPRGRSGPNGKRGHVIDYRHVISSLRRKPMALLEPRLSRSALSEARLSQGPSMRCLPRRGRAACKTTVGLLALAHERVCEAELARSHRRCARRRSAPRSRRAARHSFAPKTAAAPHVVVTLPTLAAYDAMRGVSSRRSPA